MTGPQLMTAGSLYRGFDASVPPAAIPPGCQVACGYIGGATPHVWTLDEWLRFDRLYQIPIWVGAGRTDGAGDGQAAATAMRNLGWNPDGGAGRRAVILDLEGLLDAAYANGFRSEIWAAGYQTVIYEDLYRLIAGGNPTGEGVLVADWNNTPSIPPYARVIGCQYAANVPFGGTTIDLDIMSGEMLAHAGFGPRK